jgi:hypothetical protein
MSFDTKIFEESLERQAASWASEGGHSVLVAHALKGVLYAARKASQKDRLASAKRAAVKKGKK